ETQESLSQSDVLTVAAAFLNRSETRHRELWALFSQVDRGFGDDPEKTKIKDPFKAILLKLNIVKELERQTNNEIALLQKLGIVYQAPKELVLDMKAATLLNSLAP